MSNKENAEKEKDGKLLELVFHNKDSLKFNHFFSRQQHREILVPSDFSHEIFKAVYVFNFFLQDSHSFFEPSPFYVFQQIFNGTFHDFLIFQTHPRDCHDSLAFCLFSSQFRDFLQQFFVTELHAHTISVFIQFFQ